MKTAVSASARWLAKQMENPDFREEFARAGRETAAIDQLVNASNAQRLRLGLSQNELARRFASEREGLQTHAGLLSVVAELEAFEPQSVWLFGSRAECRAQPTSDWDVLVVVDNEIPWEVTQQLRNASGILVEVHAWTVADFDVDRFVVGTCASAAWKRGIELRSTTRAGQGVLPSEAALDAARDRWLKAFLNHADDALQAQRILWANGAYAGGRRRALLELGIEQETMPAWAARWLARALLLKRGIDPGAARKVGDLVALLQPQDQARLRPILLDDDDDAVGDPDVLAGVAGAVTEAVLR